MVLLLWLSYARIIIKLSNVYTRLEFMLIRWLSCTHTILSLSIAAALASRHFLSNWVLFAKFVSTTWEKMSLTLNFFFDSYFMKLFSMWVDLKSGSGSPSLYFVVCWILIKIKWAQKANQCVIFGLCYESIHRFFSAKKREFILSLFQMRLHIWVTE